MGIVTECLIGFMSARMLSEVDEVLHPSKLDKAGKAERIESQNTKIPNKWDFAIKPVYWTFLPQIFPYLIEQRARYLKWKRKDPNYRRWEQEQRIRRALKDLKEEMDQNPYEEEEEEYEQEKEKEEQVQEELIDN